MKNIKDKALAEKIIIVSYFLESIANKNIMEPLGLTMTGYKILYILNEYGSVTISHIINCLGSTKSNVSQRLDFLERSGLIERLPTVHGDKRQVVIALTKEGRRKFEEAKNILDDKSVKFEEIFSSQEVEEMSGFLNKMFDVLINNLK